MLLDPKYKYVNIEVGKAIRGKEEAFLNLILPDGYEVYGYAVEISIIYNIKEKKSGKKCATARFFYSNGMTVGFTIDNKSALSREFMKALQTNYDIPNPQILY